jgi:Ni,Fe-hydrogenase I cytochrome b subunit
MKKEFMPSFVDLWRWTEKLSIVSIINQLWWVSKSYQLEESEEFRD